MNITIFIYGTLRSEFSNHKYLINAKFLGHAKTINKYVMFGNVSIPFVSKSQSNSTIVGEVYEIDIEALENIDKLEGCEILTEHPLQFSEKSLYSRELVPVQIVDTGITLNAWIYLSEKYHDLSIIPTGDFADKDRFIGNKDLVWYFAYGSNMNSEQMIERDVIFTRRLRGEIDGFRLMFNKIASKESGFGFANIVPQVGFSALGVLYAIEQSGLSLLDKYEGVEKNNYFRTKILVRLPSGNIMEAYVYIAHPSKISDGLLPTTEYFNHLEKGIDIWGEIGTRYLKQSLAETKVSITDKFITGDEIPLLNELDSATRYEKALPVLLNGYKIRFYIYDDIWSARLVGICDPEDVKYFNEMNFNVGADGFFQTKYFSFTQNGILEIRDWRFLVVLDEN